MTNVDQSGASAFFNPANAAWPDLANGRAFVSPARNGMDRHTGKLLQGWPHVQQSMELIFVTPFHQRVLRRWVGSFVPHILGESFVSRVVTRFYWAIISAIDLFEPDYRIKQVFFMGNALSTLNTQKLSVSSEAALIREGNAIFRQEGTWYPRGHLGDFTPYSGKTTAIVPLQLPGA